MEASGDWLLLALQMACEQASNGRMKSVLSLERGTGGSTPDAASRICILD